MDIATISTKDPLPDDLEAKAMAFLKDWQNPEFRANADRHLKGLSAAQRSLCSRRAQRLSHS